MGPPLPWTGLKPPPTMGLKLPPPIKGECMGDSMCDGDMGPGVRCGERPGV
jgi:hypothetical protein